MSPLPTGPSQHLPIPIGGADPAHLPRGRRAARPRWRTVMLGCGMITAAAGTWLTVTADPTAVYSDADGVHVGASVLRLQHADGELTVYAGDAALVVRRMAGAVVGSAVTTVHGRHVTGVCRLVGDSAGVSETCAFHQGSRTMTSRDRFDAPAHQWVRRYEDGRETRIAVPAQARLVPVPFVIGVDFA